MQAAPPRPRPNPLRQARVRILLVIFAGLWFALRAANKPEPTYADQPLSYWLERMGNEHIAAHAASVLNEMGPEALPALTDALRTESSALKDFAHACLVRARLAAPRHYDAPNIRATAAYLLGQMREEASPAAEHLIKALGDEDPYVRFKASRALARIGMVASPELAVALENPEPVVRYGAAKALGGMGDEARYAAPALLRSLDDPQSNVRTEAFHALAQIGSRAQKHFHAAHIPKLLDAVTNSPWNVSRKFAVETLRKIGPPARPALTALLEQRETAPELLPEIKAAVAAIGQ